MNLNPQWVKSIGPTGDVQHHDWSSNYNALRKETGTYLPGMYCMQQRTKAVASLFIFSDLTLHVNHPEYTHFNP